MSESERTTAVDRPQHALADTEPVPGDARPSLGAFPDRYDVGDELGRGGMGRVVEARDRMLGRTVALKEALATDHDALRRFARETQITARLEHPSIVPVYDAGVSPDGSPFYVMRKVTGRPLDKLVGAATRLDERLALLPHVVAACQAVAHAHARGVIHRDLKPSNILAGEHGETIVIDWGLAKALDERDSVREVPPAAGESLRTRAGMVFGTPGFMPPEQLDSSDVVDERADVYALGATLFYMLAQKPPHEGRSVEEIDEAARRHPPPPIASIVPGVPRELATIIDKALAYDLGARYRNAGALADDLTRFMAGQLVASHVYSRREKLARFVRRHRALVITVAAALSVLAVGAWIAVGRVLAARDEAIAQARRAEDARAREAERASDLVISQGRLLLASNPAAAVALVRPLATTKRWRDVRAIAAGARATGVPWRLPAPASGSCLRLSPDGVQALVCGGDGSLHLYDLATRAHTEIAKLAGELRATFAGEQHVVAWSGKTITIVDLATRATRALERPARIVRAAGRDGFVYFVDAEHRAWRLAAATAELIAIPIDGKVAYVAPSPDGKHVAFAGEHLWLIEARRPDLVEKIHDGKKFDIAWAADGETLAVLGTQYTYQITIHPEVEVTALGVTNHALALARGVLYTSGLSGFTVGTRGRGAADMTSSFAGLHVTRGEFVVAADRGALRVFDGEHDHRVPLPATPLALLVASPRSPYVVAVCGELLLVWNVDHVMPKRVEVPSYTQIVPVGPQTAWTVTIGGDGGRAIDLRSGQARPIGRLEPLRYAATLSGSYVIARMLGSKDTVVLDRDANAQPVPAAATTAVVLDEKRAVLATEQHEIALYDLATRQVERIAALGTRVDRLLVREANPRWIVAVLTDGTVWRHDLVSARATTTRIPARSTLDIVRAGATATAATRDGDVFVVNGARLQRWRAAADTVVDHVAMPRPILSVDLIDDARVLVRTDDTAAYLVDVAARGFVKLPPVGHGYAFVAGAPLLVTDDGGGGLSVIDLDANAAWRIARAAPAGTNPALASDGKAVVMRDATADANAVAIWDLDLPTTPEATAAWIAGLTNATFDPRTGMLGWAP